jgi:eukaryotic-like serine/threonine-protein kinase
VPADMLVALDLATATCEGKKAHFARAARDGGARTLAELSAMRNAKCGRRQTACCFQNDKSLAAALDQLRTRLGK